MDKATVSLEVYEGPLDLLLSLIARNEIDINDIPVAQVTSQYMKYIYMMNSFNVELASEFIVMAATLLEIKSRMMLPSADDTGDEDAADPREELVRRLGEYRLFKEIASALRPMEERYNRIAVKDPSFDPRVISPVRIGNLSPGALEDAMERMLTRMLIAVEGVREFYSVDTGLYSVEEMISRLDEMLADTGSLYLSRLLMTCEPVRKSDAIAVFLAALELFKRDRIHVYQTETYADILIVRKENWKS